LQARSHAPRYHRREGRADGFASLSGARSPGQDARPPAGDAAVPLPASASETSARSAGVASLDASNELTYFVGTQIAGPPVPASDWDGSDGLTLPQLWDTHTHEVRISNGVSQVDYVQNVDCLVPVGFVLDQE
jgi:hypothetical protein